eukprot:RCo020524
MVTLCSDEVNVLVLRYLQESGFTHSVFTFGNESLALKSPLQSKSIPPSALLTLLQKGIQLLEIEVGVEAGEKGDSTLHPPPCTHAYELLAVHERARQRT